MPETQTPSPAKESVTTGSAEVELDDSLVLTTDAQGLTVTHLSPRQLAWRRFKRHRMAMVSLVILGVVVLLVFIPSLVSDYGPNERLGLQSRELHPGEGGHLLGTNRNQQDMLSRVLHGGQVSLQVGMAVAFISGIVGTAVGAIAGFYGRWVDTVLMRITDLFLAIPALVVLIILTKFPERNDWAETLIGPRGSVRAVITVLVVVFWMIIARLVRSEVMSLKENDYVEAARSLGASNTRLLLRHLLPNATGVIVVAVTLTVVQAILAESALSFLGFGVDVVFTPTWGNMLNDAKSAALQGKPYQQIVPGGAIVLTVLAINYIGDGLRDALDPKQRLGGG